MAIPGGRVVDRPVKVTSSYGKEVASTVRVHEWTAEERTARVWKRLLKWWGAALFAALVPPHIPWFTLVFLSGPVAAWLTSRQGAMVEQQDAHCPDCGQAAPIEEQAESWPLGVRCEPCRNVFWINPADAAVSPAGTPPPADPGTSPDQRPSP